MKHGPASLRRTHLALITPPRLALLLLALAPLGQRLTAVALVALEAACPAAREGGVGISGSSASSGACAATCWANGLAALAAHCPRARQSAAQGPAATEGLRHGWLIQRDAYLAGGRVLGVAEAVCR